MGLGAGEIFLILVAALLVFGPKKMPELGRALGHSLHEFRRAVEGAEHRGKNDQGSRRD